MEQAGDDNALVPNDLRTAALTRVFGFEIMPAPFVIAHLQIASLLENAGAPLVDSSRAGVFLTNALTGWVPERHPQSSIFEEFRREREDSENIKQHDTILVILGNPPYNGYAGIAKIEEERDLTTAYRTPIPGIPAPQGQGLNDLYVRFFRIAERRVVGDIHVAGNHDGCGIMSFISNNAWLDGLSHPSMRHKYLTTFNSVFIDNLNGDRFRTGKTTPDGKPDPSAFSTPQNPEGIQLGTAITTLVRSSRSSTASTIELRDLWGIGKLAQLESESRHEAEPLYQTFAPVPGLGLIFAERSHSAAYVTWPRLPELLPFSCSGVKTSRDPLVIDIDRERLEIRMRKYLGKEETDAQIASLVPGAMERVGGFDPLATRSKLQERGFRAWQLVRYAYRPFDLRWLYWEPETKLLDRKREEYMAQMVGFTTWLEARQSESGDSFSRGTVVSGMADNFGNGLSNFFPEMVISTAGSLLSNVEIHENITVAAERYLASKSRSGSDLFFHALAIMHTPAYRTENAGALLGDWPRIPLPSTGEELARSASLGRSLSRLLDAESPLNMTAEWSFLGRLNLPSAHDIETILVVDADWGRLQGTKVMPGNGRVVTRDWTDVELGKINALAATQSITVDDALALLGERCVDVYLNGTACWAAVPINVWTYTLSGYQVLKKWLSYRESRILSRALRPEETQYFAQVVRRIAGILLQGVALDGNYLGLIRTATGLSNDH
jgi:predicted helicase